MKTTNYYTQVVTVTKEDFIVYLAAVKNLGTHYANAKIRDYSKLSNVQIEQIRDNYYDLLKTHNQDSPKDL